MYSAARRDLHEESWPVCSLLMPTMERVLIIQAALEEASRYRDALDEAERSRASSEPEPSEPEAAQHWTATSHARPLVEGAPICVA